MKYEFVVKLTEQTEFNDRGRQEIAMIKDYEQLAHDLNQWQKEGYEFVQIVGQAQPGMIGFAVLLRKVIN